MMGTVNILAFVLIVMVFGCNNSTGNTVDVRCSGKQLELVDKQFKICNQTGYFASDCYEQARIEQCDVIK